MKVGGQAEERTGTSKSGSMSEGTRGEYNKKDKLIYT